MTDIPILPRDQDDLLAAEYVMGLLDLPERSAVEVRLRNDAAFADRVADWEQHFAGLNDDYADAPAPDLMPAIEARLFPQAPRRSWLGNLWSLGVSAAAALAVVAYLALTPATPDFTATLVADASDVQFSAVIVQGKLTITHVAGAGADTDHSLELWVIAGDNPPVSLGILADGAATIALPGVEPGQVLAVTLEQAGGSPDGKPHGPIVAAGALAKA